MDSTLRARLHDLTLQARRLLTNETRDMLEGIYGLHQNGSLEDATTLPAIQSSAWASETRARLERLLTDEQDAGLEADEAVEKLVRETAFTWLNRLAALKMLEARGLLRQSITRGMDSNGFKLWLTAPGNEAELRRYEAGSLPLDALGEGPRDTAYRHYLLHLCAEMATQIRVLFDPDTLPTRLCPRPRALAALLALLNDEKLADAWREDETIGWIYQSFNAEELERAFREVRLSGKKFEAADIPAVTQLFTPRWIVRALVENALGRLWLEMHPDSGLRERLAYLVPTDELRIEPKLARDITLLDPACGTMHFGLVAFDLLAEMYREELERAGAPGWPQPPSVRDVSEIPAAILEHNLFGIDIDLRAVQLSALTLYLKAKALNPQAEIRQSNLACADVRPLNGERLDMFLEEMQDRRPIHERILRAAWARLRDSHQMGSLLRLEADIQSLIKAEYERYRREGQGRLPFPELREQFEEEADQEEYWISTLAEQINQALDEFANRHLQEAYFVGEAHKGMRLLNIMKSHYDVVVTNPPYMSSRKMNERLKKLVSEAYLAGKHDLYAAFIERCIEFAEKHARIGGILSMHSFMFISSYEKLRAYLMENVVIETIAHLGPGLFDVGNPGTLQTVAYVLRREEDAARRANQHGVYFRLVREPDAEAKQRGFERAVAVLRAGETPPNVYPYRQGDFAAIPGAPWVYWLTPGLRRLFQTLPKLGEIAQTYCGMTTSDNSRFLRYWWEIGTNHIGLGCTDAQTAKTTGKRWFPYMKGGSFRRWWGNQEHIVNWFSNGAEIRAAPSFPRAIQQYFRRGVTYSYLTAGSFSARLSPGGFIFDVAGSSLFPPDIPLILAILNSSFAAYALKLINPTVNFQVGDLARLPIPKASSERLRGLVERAVALARAESAEDETTYEFVAPPAWPNGGADVTARAGELAEIERQIDEEVYRLYGISDEDRQAIEAELAGPLMDGDEEEGLTPALSTAVEREEESLTPDFPTEVEREEGNASGEESQKHQPLGLPTAVEREGGLTPALSTAVEREEGLIPALSSSVEQGNAGGNMPTAPAFPPPLHRSGEGAGGEALAARWVSYAVGIALGRFQPGVEEGIGCGRLAPEQAAALRALAVPHGVAVLDPGHEDDLVALVERALALLVGEGQVEPLLAAATSGRPLAEWLARDYFKQHAQQYRKRPIYWLLQSPKKRYSLWLFHERATRDTLHLLQGQRYLGGRINRARGEIRAQRERLASIPQGAERRRLEREIDVLEGELTDLEAFAHALAAVTSQTNTRGEIVGWEPELDDGVLINLAPLWPLLPSWSQEPKQCWQALEHGDYDWSHTAMRYWPDRVRQKCQTNRSYALAHGLAAPEVV